MRRLVLLGSLGLVGCGDVSSRPLYQLEVTSAQDHDLLVYAIGAPLAPDLAAPITPARRDRGELAAETATLFALTTYGNTSWDTIELERGWSDARPGVIVAVRNDAWGKLIPVAASRFTLPPAPADDGETVELAIPLAPELAAATEVWGAPTAHCVRIVDDGPRYFVNADDHDCDGVAAPLDCDDASYCPLDAPAGCAPATCPPAAGS